MNQFPKVELGISALFLVCSIFALILAVSGAWGGGFAVIIAAFLVYATVVVYVRNVGVIHLDIIFLTFLLMYSFSVPISNFFHPKPLSQEVVQYATLISMFCIVGFSLGLLLASGRRYKMSQNTTVEADVTNSYQRVGYGLFILGAIASVVAIAATIGFKVYLSAGYAGRALLKREVGPIELGLYVCIVGILIVFTAHLLSEKPKLKAKLFVAAMVAFFTAYISFLGIRRPLFLLILGLFSCYSLIRHKPSLGKALVIFIPVFLFFSTFAQYRQLISSSGISETLYFIGENFSMKWFDVSDTELGAPFRTIYDILFREGDNIELRWGTTYYLVPLYILPSRITGGIQSLSVEYTNAYFSSDFIGIGGNMGFFPVTEAYLNFGLLGCIVVFAIFGFTLSHINRRFHCRFRYNPIMIVLFSLLVPWTGFFMRLDMASFSKGFLYSQLLPLLVAVLLAAFLRKRWR